MATAAKKPYFVKCKGIHYRIVTLKEGVDVAEYRRKQAEAGVTVLPCKRKPPTLETLKRYSDNGIAYATDGCRVEPDGVCSHGHPSWLLAMGIM